MTNGPNRADPLPIGHVLSRNERYVIEEVLGQGGFGITYRVRTPRRGLVAVKEYFPTDIVHRAGEFLTAGPGKSREFQQGADLFYREAETLRDLDPHPNIVDVISLFRKNNTVYMEMEFIDGEPLHTLLRREERFDGFRTLNILGQMTAALGFLHDANILHCDVKPQNIMIRRETNDAVLIDFGASRDIRRKRERVAVLTESYAPIEMIRPKYGPLGPRTDIYSLGAVGYCLTTGKMPLKAWDRFEEIGRTGVDPMQTCVDLRRPDIPESLAEAIDACLSIDKAGRPDSKQLLGWLREGSGMPEDLPFDHAAPITPAAPRTYAGEIAAVEAVPAIQPGLGPQEGASSAIADVMVADDSLPPASTSSVRREVRVVVFFLLFLLLLSIIGLTANALLG